MEELRKAKMDLPPPAQSNEFPKKKFGLFVEPNFEAKVRCDNLRSTLCLMINVCTVCRLV